jgi:predicted anti-sigma-YlaC factor YlaD
MSGMRLDGFLCPGSHPDRNEKNQLGILLQKRDKMTANTVNENRYRHKWFSLQGLALCIALITGCSIKQMAVNSVADTLSADGTSVFATDNDPELVGDALPFALKSMEAILQATPRHRKLLIATSAGFVQYAHAYVLQPAQMLESENLHSARKMRTRAKSLFLRARQYGIQALDIEHPGFSKTIFTDPAAAVEDMERKDVAALFWTGAAWGSAISAAKSDMSLIGDLPIVTTIMEKALKLNPDWHNGAIHEFFIVYNSARSEADGGGLASAEYHFSRAMALNQGHSIGPLVLLAESACIKQQNRQRFEYLLKQSMAFDVNCCPEYRLANIMAQRKARYLLDNIDSFFY